MLKFLLHRLTLSDIELRASELLGFSGKAVVSHYPRSVWMWIKKKTGSCWKNILRIASRKEGRYGSSQTYGTCSCFDKAAGGPSVSIVFIYLFL